VENDNSRSFETTKLEPNGKTTIKKENKMKKLVMMLMLTVVLGILMGSPVWADSDHIRGQYISTGMTQFDVIQKCGQPDGAWEGLFLTKLYYKDSGSITRILIFKGGVLVQIKTGDRN
jgi:hypothetical protein